MAPLLPESCEEMLDQVGREYKTLAQVYRAQKMVSEWVVRAAEEAYPDLFRRVRPEAEVLSLCHKAALKRWKHFGTFTQALNDAERSILRDMEAMA